MHDLPAPPGAARPHADDHGTSPHQHGGPREAELAALGIDPSTLLDFSVNTNPYGPSEGMVGALRAAAIDRYPDPTGQNARRRMAPALGVSPDEIALGNGAAELLWTLARVLCPGTTTLLAEPTFSEFRRAAHAAGARVVGVHSRAEEDFSVDLAALERHAREARATVVYLCTPNTPTGACVPASDVADFARDNPALTLVLDQSFLSLCDRHADATVAMPPNVVRVRSLTKDHAIPGVRVGYLLGRPELVRRLEDERPAWMTGSLAQAAAVAAMESEQLAFVAQSRERLLADRERLLAALCERGYAPYPTTTVFFLLRMPAASELRRRLLVRHHVLVRDCASFGLPGFMRLAVRPARDAERLLAALEAEAPAR